MQLKQNSGTEPFLHKNEQKETNITKPLYFFLKQEWCNESQNRLSGSLVKKNMYNITRQYLLSASVIMLSTSHLMLFMRGLMEKCNLLEFWQRLAQDNAGSFGCLKAWSQVLFGGYCVIWKEAVKALFFTESLGHVVTCGRSCIDRGVWRLVGFWGGWREKKLKSPIFQPHRTEKKLHVIFCKWHSQLLW